MRNVLMALVLFFSCSFSFLKDDKYCNSCQYNGGVSKVRIDEKSGKYLTVKMELGEFMLGIIEENCTILSNSFYLRGGVYAPIPKNGNTVSPVPDVLLLKAIEYKGWYQVTDTLAKTDKDGMFSFKVKDRENAYILVMQHDGTCVRYEMSSFKN